MNKRNGTHGPLIKAAMVRMGWKDGRKRIGKDPNKSSYYQKGDGAQVWKWKTEISSFTLETWPASTAPIDRWAGEPAIVKEPNVVAFRPVANLN